MWHSFRLKLRPRRVGNEERQWMPRERLPIERVLFSFPETAEYVGSYENKVFNPI